MAVTYEKFKELTYDKFKDLATDESLSIYEKIGFPDSYREDFEEKIFSDVLKKMPNLLERKQIVMDIGPGCSNLPRMLIELCEQQEHTLILIDSNEMLQFLPDKPFIKKIPGFYPSNCESLFNQYQNKINALLCYSVLHYIYMETNLFNFIDQSLTLLAPQSQFLIGDIPNISKRKRFFSTMAGIDYHQKYTNSNSTPEVVFNTIEHGNIDDSVLISLMLRSRAAGYDAYLLPQANGLPMANRREDLLITKS